MDCHFERRWEGEKERGTLFSKPYNFNIYMLIYKQMKYK